MLRKIITTAFNKNELIGVRTYDLEYDEVIIGYVTQISDESFTINELDENLGWLGKRIIFFDDIMEVTYKDVYQEGIKFLLNKTGKIKSGETVSINAKGKQLTKHLKSLLGKEEITTFYFYDEHFVTGILEYMDEHFLYIHNIGSTGQDDGWSCCRIDDLIGFRHNGLKERMIKLLYHKINVPGND